MELYVDPLIGMVFYNLHNNTVRHREHAPEIHLRTEKRGDKMVSIGEDDGIGVPLDEK